MKPQFFYVAQHRRRLLKSLLLTTGGVITSAIYAEALILTPRATEGPYYPDHLPLDQDNDLLRIADGGVATGEVVNFGGRVLDADGRAISGAMVELWQADANGCYIHSRGVQRGKQRDPLFQGYGKIQTNAKGEYRFRTIKPGLYTGRTIHWHVRVKCGDRSMLTTQLFIAGVPQNESDHLLRSMGSEEQRLSVIREFKPQRSGEKELFGSWDIVIGHTPEDTQRPHRGDDLERAIFGSSVFDGI